MRDNDNGMPEIFRGYERDGSYFGIIKIERGLEAAAFEFGIDFRGYECVKRVFQTRPFDDLAGSPYRYFFSGGQRNFSRGPQSSEEGLIRVRIELAQKAKTVEFPAPLSLIANLQWFRDLPSLQEAAHLRRIETLDYTS